MIVDQSEVFEAPATEWLYREAKRLADTLDQFDVPRDTARKVCEAFMFGLATGLDGDPVEAEGKPWQPTVVLAREETLHLPDPSTFEWHDYALGVVGEVFGDA
jgi:hypothetical protein